MHELGGARLLRVEQAVLNTRNFNWMAGIKYVQAKILFPIIEIFISFFFLVNLHIRILIFVSQRLFALCMVFFISEYKMRSVSCTLLLYYSNLELKGSKKASGFELI
jgi:hypothetical protein